MLFLPISSFFLRAQQGTAYTVFSYGIQTLLIVWGFAALLFFSRESIKQQQQTQIDQRIICQNLILDQIIMEERKPHPPVAKYGIVVIDNKITKADRCLCSQLGPRIDVKWNIDTARMELCKSQSQHFVHEKDQKEEVFRCVPFFHDKICELEDQNILKNPDFPVVPCAVVLIKDKQNRRILATKRHERMSFGNLWVLPGGHLENGETIIQGGLRQCFQEVGLKPESYSIDKNPQVMAWQSVLMNPTNTKIKRVALIIFFSVECEPFEVNEQKSEVKAWQWRQFQNGERPWGGDWAQGHLRYLDYLSKQEQNPKM